MSKRAAESSEGMADRRVSPSPAGASSAPIHVKARGPHPAYPARTSVDDKVVPWDSEFNGYAPVEFVHRAVLANDSSVKKGGWADPQARAPPSHLIRSFFRRRVHPLRGAGAHARDHRGAQQLRATAHGRAVALRRVQATA